MTGKVRSKNDASRVLKELRSGHRQHDIQPFSTESTRDMIGSWQRPIRRLNYSPTAGLWRQNYDPGRARHVPDP